MFAAWSGCAAVITPAARLFLSPLRIGRESGLFRLAAYYADHSRETRAER